MKIYLYCCVLFNQCTKNDRNFGRIDKSEKKYLYNSAPKCFAQIKQTIIVSTIYTNIHEIAFISRLEKFAILFYTSIFKILSIGIVNTEMCY